MREIFQHGAAGCAHQSDHPDHGRKRLGKRDSRRGRFISSARAGQGRSLPINCAAMPETLMESELFGHEKGAFTGAIEKRAGCFELAKGGTLLLDEIGDMPMNTQAKLLRVIEERRVRRLGSPRETELDVRMLASTNRDLQRGDRQAGPFAKTFISGSTSSKFTCRRCASGRQDIPRLATEMLVELNRRHDCRITDVAAEVDAIFRRPRLAWQRPRITQRAGARGNSAGRRNHHHRSSAARFRLRSNDAGRKPADQTAPNPSRRTRFCSKQA